jgi:hypothetical protein
MSSTERSNEAGLAASFLIEVLDLPDDVAAVADELALVDRDQVVTVFAAEFESSVGPAAFLIYVYRLDQFDDDGQRGANRFREDLNTVESAARLDTPGPRAVSHSESEDVALILATSPAILRALQGAPTAQAEPAARPVPPAELLKIREDQALRLLRVLKSADRAAAAWLAAIEASPSATPIPEETELSLFLNDEQSIRSLLRALNRLLNSSGPTKPGS